MDKDKEKEIIAQETPTDAVPAEDGAVEETPEVKPSRRDDFLGRLKKKYPDKSYDDDDAIYGQAIEDYDDYDRRLGEYQEREGKLGQMFRRDPRSAAFLSNWKEGADPVVELVRQFGTDIVGALDDPERVDEIAAANKDFLDRLAKNKELEEEYQNNVDATLSQLASMKEERGLSDDEIDDAMEMLQQIVTDGIVGKFSPESIELALKARGYDRDVAEAGHVGEVRGRNSKIQETLKKRGKDDGLAVLAGRNGGTGVKERPSFGALDKMAGGNIWERGQERRVRRE